MLKPLKIFCLVFALNSQINWAQDSLNMICLGRWPSPSTSCWGYSQNGKEYGIPIRNYLFGARGVGFYLADVTDPQNLLPVFDFESPDLWMWEVETYKNYAYVCTDFAYLAPIMIFDLSFLPDSVPLVGEFHNSIGGCHTFYIQGDYCYCSNGPVEIIDLKNPLAPVTVNTITTHPDGWAHGSFVRKDTLFVADTYRGVYIYDIKDKSHPVFLRWIFYSDLFTHSVWTTDDGKYLLTTDENEGGHLKIWDIQDLSNVRMVSEFKTNSQAIIHNVYVKGNLAFLAYYTDGLRVLDISDPADPLEIAYYDTSPFDTAKWVGAWAAYPYLPSGNILVSDTHRGLFVLKLNLKGGDLDRDGVVTLPELIFLVNYLFKNGPAPRPRQLADANSDCKTNLTDVIYLVNYLFKDGDLPQPACFK